MAKEYEYSPPGLNNAAIAIIGCPLTGKQATLDMVLRFEHVMFEFSPKR